MTATDSAHRTRPSAAQPRTRNAERTRREIIDTATRLMGEHGVNVALANIAAEAGISKGGMLHHFSSRETLVAAVIADVVERFRHLVLDFVDLSENQPGKLLRAYVRALCGGSSEAAQYFSDSPIWHGVTEIDEVVPLLADDSAWWDEHFAADGLDEDRVRLVRRAAEGMAAAASLGEETPDSQDRMRTLLLALCEPTGTFPPTNTATPLAKQVVK